MHILARCTFNKNLITKRHDHLVQKIAKELKKTHPNASIWCERSWRSGTELMRPDITMVNGEKVSIIEVPLPYETSEEYLEISIRISRKEYLEKNTST